MHLKVPMGLWSTIQYAVGSYGEVLSKRSIKVIQWTCNDQAMKQKDTWQRKSAEQATIIINVPNTVNNKIRPKTTAAKTLLQSQSFQWSHVSAAIFSEENTRRRRGRKLENVAYYYQRRWCVDSYISTFSNTLDCAAALVRSLFDKQTRFALKEITNSGRDQLWNAIQFVLTWGRITPDAKRTQSEGDASLFRAKTRLD